MPYCYTVFYTPRCCASAGCPVCSPKGHGGIRSVTSSKSWIVYYVWNVGSGLVYRADGFWAQEYDTKKDGSLRLGWSRNAALFLLPAISIGNAVCCFLKARIDQTLSILKRTDFIIINKRRLNMMRIIWRPLHVVYRCSAINGQNVV